ncbi:hypothetical protein [Brevibacillus centrosporus]|uniref:hypothetical protein n=1 Tax=Brevibacillus centrosporus TaxID=54910 RepID=UPI002E21FC85|nr:hypothetical protein [Brevibacillus centrosporus]
MKSNLAYKDQGYTMHIGRSDPANIMVYVKVVPREETTRKLAPIIAGIYRSQADDEGR